MATRLVSGSALKKRLHTPLGLGLLLSQPHENGNHLLTAGENVINLRETVITFVK
jgi:hypothetical protein